jgi:aminopeptidase N
MPPIEPGVSHELAKWRAARYSDVRYKLNLTLEKMSPVLKGTIEIHVRVSRAHVSKGHTPAIAEAQADNIPAIVLDWRTIKGFEDLSLISNISINGQPANADRSVRAPFEESHEHVIFRDGVVLGENVIKLDFTSPVLTSGSAITRYVDKEDGAEYIYSLFVPSDASTAFPVFDQPRI